MDADWVIPFRIGCRNRLWAADKMFHKELHVLEVRPAKKTVYEDVPDMPRYLEPVLF